MLEFGRELFQMGQRLDKENGANDTNRRMLEVRVAFLRLGLSFPASIFEYATNVVLFFSFLFVSFIFHRMHLVC